MRPLLALALILIPAAHAETYKWVDEKGVVNYSNTPPTSAARNIQPVADRISTYNPDPTLQRAIAYGPSPYELMAQQEWLQRQQLMATAQQQQAARAAYSNNDYAYGYPYSYGPVVTTRNTRATRAPRPPHVAHHRGRATATDR